MNIERKKHFLLNNPWIIAFLFLACCMAFVFSLMLYNASQVDRVIEEIRQSGAPTSLEEMGITLGGYEHPDWPKLAALLDDLKEAANLRRQQDVYIVAMEHTGPGKAIASTLKDSSVIIRDNKILSWEEVLLSLKKEREIIDLIESSLPDSTPWYVEDYYYEKWLTSNYLSNIVSVISAANQDILCLTALQKYDMAIDKIVFWDSFLSITNYVKINALEGILHSFSSFHIDLVVWEILQHELSDQNLSKLATANKRFWNTQDILKITVGERIFMQNIYKIGWHDQYQITLPHTDNAIFHSYYGLFGIHGDVALTLRNYFSVEQKIADWADGEMLKITKDKIDGILNQVSLFTSTEKYRYPQSYSVTREILTNITMPINFYTFQLLTKTAIALKRYHLKHGAYPEKLEHLVPNFLTEMPRDPADWQPLRYRLLDDGDFLLYGIGSDCVDDGGDGDSASPTLSIPHRWKPYHARDIVWPRRE